MDFTLDNFVLTEKNPEKITTETGTVFKNILGILKNCIQEMNLVRRIQQNKQKISNLPKSVSDMFHNSQFTAEPHEKLKCLNYPERFLSYVKKLLPVLENGLIIREKFTINIINAAFSTEL